MHIVCNQTDSLTLSLKSIDVQLPDISVLLRGWEYLKQVRSFEINL
jgi:hypothetical protein